jgi:AcrR family transcriptional regulator
MTPRRKDVEPLARESIVVAAMKIIDTEGLDALSMRRLGAELGVNPMAAYYHVPNKAALYDLVLDAVMAGCRHLRDRCRRAAAEQLKQAARAYRAAILEASARHPGARDALSSGPRRRCARSSPSWASCSPPA